KLAPLMTVFSFEEAFNAIEEEDFKEEKFGIPILPYDRVMEREVDPPGALGPLHTQFDDRGNAYNTMFISSEIVKWNIDSGEVIDRIPNYFSPGHAAASQGDTVDPKGDWIVGLNKLAKDNFLSVGPSHPESMDLIDISGEKMEHIMAVPVDPEPHYAQIVHRDKIDPIKIYEKDEDREDSVWNQEDAHIVRDGDEVHVYGIAMRSRFIFDAEAERPDVVEVNEGDKVFFHLTNIDLDQDITHGFGINDYDLNFEVQPGQTSTLEFLADKTAYKPTMNQRLIPELRSPTRPNKHTRIRSRQTRIIPDLLHELLLSPTPRNERIPTCQTGIKNLLKPIWDNQRKHTRPKYDHRTKKI